MTKGPNRPFVVWGVSFLWLTSMFAVTWALLLFFCVGDILMLTGTDLVIAMMLLTGIVMIPPNLHMLCSIANGTRIDYRSKVVCCPLWLCIVWMLLVNIVGVFLCVQRITSCGDTIENLISVSMNNYRSASKYKHFMDNMQWSLKCCGLNSYRDWFTRDWYDKIRDYEWDSLVNKRNAHAKNKSFENDSVPLSCCKSGSCISNYLSELGTYSINTVGCGAVMHRLITVSMFVHLTIFLLMISVQLSILKLICSKDKYDADAVRGSQSVYNVQQIMRAKDDFEASSVSYQGNPDDSDDLETPRNFEVMDIDAHE